MESRSSLGTENLILDADQARAVSAPGGPVVVLGEPGTGKTTVVVERAARLIESGVPKERLLVLSLSRRSADDLAARLAARLADETPTVATFHSFALGLLHRHYRAAGYRQPPRLMAGREGWQHLAATLERESPANWPRYGGMLRSRTLLALAYDLLAGSAHNALAEEEVLDRLGGHGRSDLTELVRFLGGYLGRLRRQGLVDPQWALVEAMQLLEERLELAIAHRDRYPHLLVDEFEEATYTQARLASLLGGNGLFVAGNPDQGINSFQGGGPAYLEKLAGSREARVIRLATGHRSSAAIERSWRSLMEAEEVRGYGSPQTLRERVAQGARSEVPSSAPRTTHPALAEGAPPTGPAPETEAVELRAFAHQGEEPAWIAAEILSLLRSGLEPRRMAVLFRSGNDPVARELSARLRHLGVPFRPAPDPRPAGGDPAVETGHDEGPAVVLLTLHQARGREWEIVFLPDLVEGVYPLRRSPIGSLAPLLLRGEGGEPRGIRERRLAEERRLLLVGLSRARRKVHLTHSATGLDGASRLSPSRYLSRLPVRPVADGEIRRQGVEDLLIHYRRQLRAEDPVARAQALYALKRLAAAFPGRVVPDLWWDTQDETTGAAHPYPDGSLRLSASRLAAYRDCPLQYKFAQHLALEEVSGDAMTLGTLIHDVLEAYHDPRADHPRDRETLESLADGLFDPASFSHPSIARQARAKATGLLDAYFQKHGRAGEVLAVETAFSFGLGPHVVSGRIDRIDRRPDGTLELIDYKTGSAVSYAEAGTDLQLALYDLAFQRVPELARKGRPGRATYLFLKALGPRADGKRGYEPTEGGRQALLARIERYSSGILAEAFPPRSRIRETWPDLEPEELSEAQGARACRNCSFTWLCPERERRTVDD